MKPHLVWLFLWFSSVLCSQTHADMILNMADNGTGFRIDYSGTLDMTGLAFTNLNVSNEHTLRLTTPAFGNVYTQIVNVPTSQVRAYTGSVAFSVAPTAYYIGNLVAATSSGGSAIILPTGTASPNATLRLNSADFVGNVWSGSGFLQFDGTSLASLGISSSVLSWTINNASANTITLNISAVPEPGSMLLLASSLGMFGWFRRRVAAT